MMKMEAELELYSVGADGFEDDFIGQKFVAYREFGLAA
jgi:hypothetical protein